MGKLIKILILCGLVALFFASYGDKIIISIQNIIRLSGDVASRQSSPVVNITNSMEIPLQNDGHYWVEMAVNNTPINFIVDTGASFVTLSHADAEKLYLYISENDYIHNFRTAGGTVNMAEVNIDRLSVGFIEVYNVKAYVAREGMLSVSLLGMNFLNKLESFEFRDKELLFQQ